ncbi:MAG: NAD-dependent epimerase/dehydratase family protein [Acetobacteraceae bacterium]
MRILLTGASSFTGFWFARALHAAGHHVVAALHGARGTYTEGVRAVRVAQLSEVAECAYGLSFGDPGFLDLCRTGAWDLLCHHAAQVGDHRASDFDIPGALAANTRELPAVLRQMRGLAGMVLTGTVFEANEGAGTTPLRAFSPYGVSKGLTAEVVRYWCATLRVPLGKFVIPNPFGPYEEPRFCAYLMRQWKAGSVAEVRTPAYVRDNIHADLLARAYAEFVLLVPGGAGFIRLNPSGYAETQGAFAQRFAREIGDRLRLECRLVLAEQAEFPEPVVRINTDRAVPDGWNERSAWDGATEYYKAA